MDLKEFFELQKKCDRFLNGRHYQTRSPKHVLEKLADQVDPDLMYDLYGQGAFVESFESEIAAVLGKESAVFMPSGTMAQQIALRIWSERSGCKTVLFHPRSHLETMEQKGYQFLHGLNSVLVGSADHLMTLDDLHAVHQPASALLLELPQRDIGGQLPSWEDLKAIVEWAKSRDIKLHMDGARLWECKPYYQKEYAEISALFDSVYVSMYKGLEAIAGSVLAGTEEFISEARIWMRRHGGNLISLYPYILSAKYGFDHYLPKMEKYCKKTLEVARMLTEFPGVTLLPDPPQVNMMHVFINGEVEKLEAVRNKIAVEEKVMLFRRFIPTQVPGVTGTEITILDGAFDFDSEELKHFFEMFFRLIRE